MIEKAKFTYSPLEKAFGKETKTLKVLKVEALKVLKSSEQP